MEVNSSRAGEVNRRGLDLFGDDHKGKHTPGGRRGIYSHSWHPLGWLEPHPRPILLGLNGLDRLGYCCAQ